MINSNNCTLVCKRPKGFTIARSHLELDNGINTVQIISDLNVVRVKFDNQHEKAKYITFEELYNHLSNI